MNLLRINIDNVLLTLASICTIFPLFISTSVHAAPLPTQQCTEGTLIEPSSGICSVIRDRVIRETPVTNEVIIEPPSLKYLREQQTQREQRSLTLPDSQSPPQPGGMIGSGIIYRKGTLQALEHAELHTKMFVHPNGVNPSLPGLSWLFSTATNRSDNPVEVVGIYYEDNPDGSLGLFDWSCTPDYRCEGGETGASWIWTNYFTAFECNLKEIVDQGGHVNTVMQYANQTSKLDDGNPPLRRNAVYLWNTCEVAWDLVYEHEYRTEQRDCSQNSECAWWGPIIETFSDVLPEIDEMGFEDSMLLHDGVWSELRPDETDYRYPPYPWQLFHLDPNRSYGVGNRVVVDDTDYQDLSTWDQLNAIEILATGDDEYQLLHPGTNWPILNKDLPVIPPGAQLKISFSGSSSPAGASMNLNPWALASTGGGHIYLSDTETYHERVYTNETGDVVSDAFLQFHFEDSLASGVGQTIRVRNLQVELNTAETLLPTDDANPGADLPGQLAVSEWEHAFLRFDISAAPAEITQAKLRVYDDGRYLPHTLYAAGVNDDDWSEATVTPVSTNIRFNPEVVLDSSNVTAAGYVELDVTEFVTRQLDDGIASFELSTNLFTWSRISSREGEHPPQLIIATGTVADPRLPTDDANPAAELPGQLVVSEWEHAFLRFDVRDVLQEITQATLRVYDDGRYLPHTLYAAEVYEDDWSENSGTPQSTYVRFNPEVVLDSREVTDVGYVEFDVTEFVNRQVYDGVATFELSTNLGTWSRISSREGEYPPQLVLQTSDELIKIRRVNVTSNGEQADSWSRKALHNNFSNDNRYVVFSSSAILGIEVFEPSVSHLYVHDLAAGSTSLVSQFANESPYKYYSTGMLSGNGHYVVFDALSDDGERYQIDIFLHDRLTDSIQRISETFDGMTANGVSYSPRISADGRYITFATLATNLVDNTTEWGADVLLYDRETAELKSVCISSDGEVANSLCDNGGISADSEKILFNSFADNLVTDELVPAMHMYVHNRQDQTTQLVSPDSVGWPFGMITFQGYVANPGDNFDISQDGRFVVFTSTENGLVGDPENGTSSVFVRDLETGDISRVSESSIDENATAVPSISADGRYVAFSSGNSNLVDDDTNGFIDIFIHDRNTGKTIRITNNGIQTNNDSNWPTISPDGRFVIFESSADNLVVGDTNGDVDVFVAPVVFD